MTSHPRGTESVDERARTIALAVPAVIPVGMAALFLGLRRRLGDDRRAYNAGFALYWALCVALPVTLLGPRRTWSVLTRGTQPSAVDTLLLALPVVGATATELLPNRTVIDGSTATAMMTSAAVNAVGEELLWRGLYLELFPDDIARGAVWPLAGFVAWHLAPQTILPSRRGRLPFLAGPGAVGAASTRAARAGRGLRWTLLPHIATDACGVNAARYRLGPATANPEAR